MREAIQIKISATRKRMGAYVILENFRDANLCVKAETFALMPVEVDFEGNTYPLEKIADVTLPDDYHFGVYPHYQRALFAISKAIKLAHPEFGIDMLPQDENDEEGDKKLLLSMPQIDKDRRDAYMTAIDGYHTECRLNLDREYAAIQKDILSDMKGLPAEAVKEVSDEMKKQYDWHLEQSDRLMEMKKTEVEEAYRQYQQEMERREAERREREAAHGEAAGTQLDMSEHHPF